jgi:threonine dehydrogenase-like Zn-dependent dehydrogenase
MQRGLIDPLPLLSDILPLEKAEEAFQKSQDKGILKILLSI